MKSLNWLPIGSVVKLREQTRDILIVSRGFIVPKNDRFVYFDYCGIDANEVIQNSLTYLFNTDSVEEVVFTGWESAKQSQLEKRFLVNVVAKGVKKAKQTIEETTKRSF